MIRVKWRVLAVTWFVFSIGLAHFLVDTAFGARALPVSLGLTLAGGLVVIAAFWPGRET